MKIQPFSYLITKDKEEKRKERETSWAEYIDTHKRFKEQEKEIDYLIGYIP